jgi:hypothetical protein
LQQKYLQQYKQPLSTIPTTTLPSGLPAGLAKVAPAIPTGMYAQPMQPQQFVQPQIPIQPQPVKSTKWCAMTVPVSCQKLPAFNVNNVKPINFVAPKYNTSTYNTPKFNTIKYSSPDNITLIKIQ